MHRDSQIRVFICTTNLLFKGIFTSDSLCMKNAGGGGGEVLKNDVEYLGKYVFWGKVGCRI